MVVKQVGAKKATGSFKGLANYLLDVNKDGKKVESYHFENCNFDSVELNLKEIEITTNLNQIANSDKVLHLVVSFRENEHPSKELLKTVEDELVKSIGMQEHQRLVVAHNNTNNFHIHIVINKIHPKTKKFRTQNFECENPPKPFLGGKSPSHDVKTFNFGVFAYSTYRILYIFQYGPAVQDDLIEDTLEINRLS